MGILKRILDHEYKEMKKFKKLADEIVSYDDIVEVNNKRHLLKRIKQKEPLIMDIYI